LALAIKGVSMEERVNQCTHILVQIKTFDGSKTIINTTKKYS
jgi:hypothetical protein